MSGFSIDDVRDTFASDMSTLLGKVETLGHQLMEGGPSVSDDALKGLASLGDCFHTAYGTSILVGAKSLAGTADKLEELAASGALALRRIEEEREKARAAVGLCLEGTARMRDMLALELDHRRAEAERVCDDFRRSRLDPPAPAKVPVNGKSQPPPPNGEVAFGGAEGDEVTNTAPELLAVFGQGGRPGGRAPESHPAALAKK